MTRISPTQISTDDFKACSSATLSEERLDGQMGEAPGTALGKAVAGRAAPGLNLLGGKRDHTPSGETRAAQQG